MSCLIVPMWLFFLRFVLFILDKRALYSLKTSINLDAQKIYCIYKRGIHLAPPLIYSSLAFLTTTFS